jgi:hypothetical protein
MGGKINWVMVIAVALLAGLLVGIHEYNRPERKILRLTRAWMEDWIKIKPESPLVQAGKAKRLAGAFDDQFQQDSNSEWPVVPANPDERPAFIFQIRSLMERLDTVITPPVITLAPGRRAAQMRTEARVQADGLGERFDRAYSLLVEWRKTDRGWRVCAIREAKED